MPILRKALSSSVITLATISLPSFAQIEVPGGALCQQGQYRNTIACLPTLTAFEGTVGSTIYGPGTPVPIAVPLALGAQYATQVSTSPSAATSAGILFSFQNGALTAKASDMGPLLSELPQTVGHHRIYVGTSYQWLQFTQIGGQPMSSFLYNQTYADPGFHVNDGIHVAQAEASLKVHNIQTYVAYGITDRLEVSSVLPWSYVAFHFQTACTAAELAASNSSTSCQVQNDVETFTFFAESERTKTNGIGDITLRGKFTLLKRQHAGVGLGLEYRLPTGAPLDLRGTGANGLRPFLIWSHDGWLSPHANASFQYNGSSVIDIHDDYIGIDRQLATTAPKSKIPNIVSVSGGADLALGHRINLDADFLERVFSNDGSKQFLSVGSAKPPVAFTGAKDKLTLLVGAKYRVGRRLLASANVMMDLTKGSGMTYKPSPVGTLAYSFGATK